jgi:hypothetical protein
MKKALFFCVLFCAYSVLTGCKKDNVTVEKPLTNHNLLTKPVVDTRQDTIKPNVVKIKPVVDLRQDTIKPNVVKGIR